MTDSLLARANSTRRGIERVGTVPHAPNDDRREGGGVNLMPESDDVHWICDHPDFELFETNFQDFLELAEEIKAFLIVWDVCEDAHQIVTIGLSLVPPCALNRLRL